MKALGLDLGTKRVGIALAEGQLVVEYVTIAMNDRLADELKAIIDEEQIELLVIGLPMSQDGSESTQAEHHHRIGQELAEKLKIKVSYVDEKLTTNEARRRLAEEDIKPEQIEQRVDQYSARLILEDYLSQQTHQKNLDHQKAVDAED